MSHVTKIEVSIDSLDALAKAASSLGGTLHLGQTTAKGWSSNQCSHAISVPGATFEVGIVPHDTQEGRWTLAYDPWAEGRGLHKALGDGLCKLKQAYTVERSKAQLKREGWMLREQRLPSGHVKLVATKM